MKRLLAITALLGVLLMCISGCQGVKSKYITIHTDATRGSDEDADGEEIKTEEKVKEVYALKYKELSFVSDEEKEKWREPLLKLISNRAIPIFDKENACIDGYSYPRPNEPGIAFGYSYSLFDINIDGVPELLVNLGGGSAGNAYYAVYDIMSGAELGALDGGHNDSWCIYFNTQSGQYECIGQFQWRGGWMGRTRYIKKAMLTKAHGDSEADAPTVYQIPYMSCYYSIDAIFTEPTEEQREQGIESVWTEVYKETEYQVHGDGVTLDEYYKEYDSFVNNYIRITETGLKVLSKWDGDDVDYEAIVDGLLSLEQSFIAG